MARLPATGFGTTSLGAVGGARGTAAGAIRILVEFLTQYDSAAVKELEADLQGLASADNQAIARREATQKALNTLKEKQAKIEAEIRKTVSATDHPRAVRTAITEARNVGLLSKRGPEQLREALEIRGLDEKTLNRIVHLEVELAETQRARAAAATRFKNQSAAEESIAKRRLVTETQLTAQQRLRAGLAPKLGGLAIGALGGIVGGAVLGVGFTAAEAALAGIAEKLQDIVDPARKARQEIEGVGEAIRKLASENGGDLEAAAGEFLKEFGLNSDQRTRAILAEAAGIQFANEQLRERIRVFEILTHFEELRKQAIIAVAQQMAREAGAQEELIRGLKDEAFLRGRPELQAQALQILAAAERTLGGAKEQAADASARATREAQLREAALRAQAAAASLAALAEQNLAAALAQAAAPRFAAFDRQLAALQNAGPSARTRGLEARIEKLQNAGNGGQSRQRSQELANIAEERALILLRQRLRLMGTNINLEKFSGKFLLEAINAKLRALQKEAAAQDRLNRLLDLQFRMAQKIRRNEGESITDFLQRRAQENRDMLSEQRDIERETVEERLRELQEKTQDEVALQELAERAKNAAAKSGADNRIAQLQKELQKSREADRKALQAKIDAVNKAKQAYKEQYDSAAHYAKESTNVQIREAIRALKTVGDLSKISGSIAGLSAAKTFLEALLASGALSPQQAQLIQGALADIARTINAYERQKNVVIARAGHMPGTRGPRFAEGGVIMLNNSSTPFGANVHFGEEGSEAAVILQHKIAEGLKGMQGGIGEANFYLESRDPLRDKYMLKQVVKEAVAETLR